MTEEHNRMLSADLDEGGDEFSEESLRPQRLSQYIGQDKVINELTIYIEAAKRRSEALDHVLIYGPPGLGKTTLAFVIANEMNVNIHTTSGPAIEKPGDLMVLLNELNAGDILFIDEIHRLPRIVEEMLYSAMEDYYVDIIIGQDATARPVHFTLPPFTLIGATTKAGNLSSPLRTRFGIVLRMDFYEEPDLKKIITRTSGVLNTQIEADGALEIARRSRGTPRIANRLLRRVRDYAQINADGVITSDVADDALNLLEVDDKGLDATDRQILRTMIDYYHGGPVGIGSISATIGEDRETIEDMYEPYLLQIGFIHRTQRGRIVSKTAYLHLGYPVKK